MSLKVSSAKRRPFCLGHNVLNWLIIDSVDSLSCWLLAITWTIADFSMQWKSHQDDCPGRHWRCWRQASASGLTTRAVTLTLFSFLSIQPLGANFTVEFEKIHLQMLPISGVAILVSCHQVSATRLKISTCRSNLWRLIFQWVAKSCIEHQNSNSSNGRQGDMAYLYWEFTFQTELICTELILLAELICWVTNQFNIAHIANCWFKFDATGIGRKWRPLEWESRVLEGPPSVCLGPVRTLMKWTHDEIHGQNYFTNSFLITLNMLQTLTRFWRTLWKMGCACIRYRNSVNIWK